jgi:hypothetical protein
MDTVLGLSLTHTGRAYPFFGTLLGWLGVALTGTDAGSNALFGNLQKVTALQLGLSPILMAAANSCGGVMGKMIDAQSIVVARPPPTRRARRPPSSRRLFLAQRSVLACLVGVLVTIYAFVLPGWYTGRLTVAKSRIGCIGLRARLIGRLVGTFAASGGPGPVLRPPTPCAAGSLSSWACRSKGRISEWPLVNAPRRTATRAPSTTATRARPAPGSCW